MPKTSKEEMSSWIGTSEVARRLGVSISWVNELAKRNEIEHVSTTLGRLFDPDSVEELRKRREDAG